MSTSLPVPDTAPRDDIDIDDLRKSLLRVRSLTNYLLNAVTALLTLAAVVPLFSVVWMLVLRGAGALSLASFTQPTGLSAEGFGNAIAGSLLIVGMATLISVPIGVMGAVYLAEIGPETRLAEAVRFSAKTLTGFPSVLAGVVTYAFLVLYLNVCALTGAVALSLLMLPTIVLTAEDAIRMVPARIREAAIGMGATRAQTILRVLLPTAMPGIFTGIMLAIARAAGETAPLLFTIGANKFWPAGPVDKTEAMAVFIYNASKMSEGSPARQYGWACALVLVVIVLVANLVGQSLSKRTPR